MHVSKAKGKQLTYKPKNFEKQDAITDMKQKKKGEIEHKRKTRNIKKRKDGKNKNKHCKNVSM